MIVLIAVLFCCPVLAPVAVANKVRTRMATAYVAMVAIWLIYFFGFHGNQPSWKIRLALIALPVLVAVAAHLGRLRRWYVPCRTVALVLVWPVLVVAILMNQLSTRHISPLVGVIAAWLLAGSRSAGGWPRACIRTTGCTAWTAPGRAAGPAGR